jgi:aminoglycoside phosphotransferase (APT) family kinase protein/SAM-dependent methyltransferase
MSDLDQPGGPPATPFVRPATSAAPVADTTSSIEYEDARLASADTAEWDWLPQLREIVSRQGWAAGLRAVTQTLPDEAFYPLINIIQPKRTAWQLLVAAPRARRALCLDATIGTASLQLSVQFEAVYVVAPNDDASACIRARIIAEGADNVRVVRSRRPTWPFAAASFDAVVIAGVHHFLSPDPAQPDARRELAQLVAEARRVLADAGTLHVAGANRHGYDGLLGKRHLHSADGRGSQISLARLQRAVSASGFTRQRSYALLPEATLYTEIRPVGEPPRETAKSQGVYRRVAERVKSSALLTPSFLLSGSTSNVGGSFMNELLPELQAQVGERLGWRSRPRLLRFLVSNPNAVILMIREPGRQGGTAIVRVPLDRESLDRCRSNVASLGAIAASPARLAKLVPRVLHVGSIGSRPFFVEEGLTGEVAEDWGPRTPDAVAEALRLIVDMHRRTAITLACDEGGYRQRIAAALNAIAPDLRGDDRVRAERIDALLKATFIGRDVPLVRTHGDYKIENVMFDGTRTVGVIDWDLSRPDGLPMIDVLYLLVMLESARSGAPQVDVMREKLVVDRWTRDERQIIDEYAAAMCVPSDWTRALGILCWLDHLAFRMFASVRVFPSATRTWFSEIADAAFREVAV